LSAHQLSSGNYFSLNYSNTFQFPNPTLNIGNDNQIREFCTINRGTEKEESVTRVGSNNLFMAYVHIAHDCYIGDHIIMSNNASLAGHVRIQNWAILGGFTLVKQFCMIGMHTYIGMGCQINKDIPSYMLASGVQTRVRSINAEGMRRRGYDKNCPVLYTHMSCQ
jgi:UDP-N-acetylglucosamine acyltransferase